MLKTNPRKLESEREQREREKENATRSGIIESGKWKGTYCVPWHRRDVLFVDDRTEFRIFINIPKAIPSSSSSSHHYKRRCTAVVAAADVVASLATVAAFGGAEHTNTFIYQRGRRDVEENGSGVGDAIAEPMAGIELSDDMAVTRGTIVRCCRCCVSNQI